MAWPTYRIENWRAILDLVDRLNFDSVGDLWWSFRGQSDASWTLLPSFSRAVSSPIPLQRALGIEAGILRQFQSQFHLHAGYGGFRTQHWDRVAWWMLMQHHSCPTRLLDWSESPFVALYFAAAGDAAARDGALWVLPSSKMQTLADQQYGRLAFADDLAWEQASGAVYPVLAGQLSARAAAQQGTFTVSTDPLADQEPAIATLFGPRAEAEGLSKYVIPSDMKAHFIARLREMNVTPASLFPGLDGIGRAARDYIRVRMLRERAPKS